MYISPKIILSLFKCNMYNYYQIYAPTYYYYSILFTKYFTIKKLFPEISTIF